MNAPKLRFKEFSGEWESETFEEAQIRVIDGDRGSNYPNGSDFSNEGYCLFLNAKNVTKSGFRFDEVSFISQQKDKLLRKGKLVRNDIVLTTRGTVGNFSFYDESIKFQNIRINSGMVLLRNSSDKISTRYLYIYFFTENFASNINKISFGSAQPQLTVSEIKKFFVRYPTFPEQTKIASFLTAIDEKIAQLTKKHELLSEYKKGVMQQIFSQQLRFKDDNGKEFAEWEEKTLGEITKIIGGGTPDTSKDEYWGGGIIWLTPTELKRKYISNSIRTITKEGMASSSAKSLPKGTVLFSSRATVGDVGIAISECTTNQGFQSFIACNDVYNEFLYYWIKANVKAFIEKASGSTFLEISKKEIEKIRLLLPCIEEQTKIANFLSSIDQKIDQAAAQLDVAKQYKRGLLQQMFV